MCTFPRLKYFFLMYRILAISFWYTCAHFVLSIEILSLSYLLRGNAYITSAHFWIFFDPPAQPSERHQKLFLTQPTQSLYWRNIGMVPYQKRKMRKNKSKMKHVIAFDFDFLSSGGDNILLQNTVCWELIMYIIVCNINFKRKSMKV